MAFGGLQSLTTGFNNFIPIEDMPALLTMLNNAVSDDDYAPVREELAKNPSALEDMLRESAGNTIFTNSQGVVYQLSSMICDQILEKDNVEALEILLDAGLSPDTMVMESELMTSTSRPMLYVAVKKDALQCVSLMLERDASPNVEIVENVVNGFGQQPSITSTSLNCALERGNTEIADLLLMYNAETYPDSIYTAYAIAKCDSREMLEKIESNPAWNIDGVNWFEAMISKAGISKFVKPFSADDFGSSMFFMFEGCIENLYRNNLLMDFLISNSYITAEFINKTMLEAPKQSHGVTMVDGLNQLAEADLLNGIDDYAAQLICEEVIKARSYSKLVFCYEVSPKLEEFMKSVKVESDDFE